MTADNEALVSVLLDIRDQLQRIADLQDQTRKPNVINVHGPVDQASVRRIREAIRSATTKGVA